jgi:NhaP-type Na+/H+ or K+/H+ antiporter
MNMMSPPHHVSYANAMSSLVIVIGFCCSILLISVTATETITITSHSIVNFTILWVASLLGGYLFSVVKIPLLGSLVVGILLRNIFDINLPEIADTIRTVSLCTILLMSSVEIDLQKLWQLGMVCVRLTSLPGMIEALVSGAFASLLFKMPFTLALGLGYILSAVSPAIVVPGMLSLKSQG